MYMVCSICSCWCLPATVGWCTAGVLDCKCWTPAIETCSNCHTALFPFSSSFSLKSVLRRIIGVRRHGYCVLPSRQLTKWGSSHVVHNTFYSKVVTHPYNLSTLSTYVFNNCTVTILNRRQILRSTPLMHQLEHTHIAVQSDQLWLVQMYLKQLERNGPARNID